MAIRKYSDKIQIFIDKKEEYEKSLIIGDYAKANTILDQIEKEVCFSLWGIEQRFILIEIEKGLKENTKFLNDINEQNKKWFIKRFSHFFSLKAEKELSVNQYNISLARLLFRYIESDNQVDLHYYNFKLNFLEVEQQTLLPDFLAIEGYHSIIDKYISLIRILQTAVLENNKDKKAFLDSRIYYLSKKVNDFNIDKLRLLIDTNFDFEFSVREQDLISLRALDYYTNGEYEKVEELLKDMLIKNPLSIELYEIYLKSLVLQEKPLSPIGQDSNSFQNRILKALYGILLRSDSMPECLNEIRKIAFNISSVFSLSFYLMNFYKEEVEGKDIFKQQGILNTKFLNPSFIRYLSESCLNNKLSFEFINSSSLAYLFQQQSGTLQTIEASNLPQSRKKILNAFLYQKNEQYEDSIKLWEEMINEASLKNFQKEKVLQNLFRCYEELSKFDKCIDLYVDNYFDNPLLVSNIIVDRIKKKIKTAKYKNVNHTINLPLFYKLTNSEDYDVHTAYECYLIAQDCFTPTELIELIKNNIDEKIIYFLADICTLDIFKHSPFITSSKHKYNERINVCKNLVLLDSISESEYNDEIERLTKRLIIQKGIQEIDESKIYVNQTGIIETELKNITSIFRRFKMIGELKSEKDISILSLYSDKMFSYKMSDEEDGNEFSKDPQFDIYKDIFYFLRDKFLFSNYGLQQYLSARIRHGVLLGEIRPEFENLNLITEKEKGIDSYKINSSWDLFTLQLNEAGGAKFQEILSDFSTNIDALINEEILSRSLQIKIEDKNPLGWLDYNYDDFILQISYLAQSDIESVEEFSNAIFTDLWTRTEKNLSDIKAKINGEIKEKFFELLLTLEQGLIDVFGKIPEQLTNNINEARVNIENKLIKVANWFSITESNISDFQIEKIVDVSLEYNKSILPIKEINCNCLFKGVYYPPLVDLVRIFMDNATKHAGFDDDNVKFHVLIAENRDMLNMQFRNPLAPTIDIEKLRTKICSFTLDLNKSMKEKGSGFHKAMRIVKSDLIHKENDMSLSLNDKNEFCIDISLNKKTLLA
ncbi:hypothetical protein [Plebeiibacterium sediminum]|uniref:Uncharacterized protein n=1 Tax=Plebeiibacterium sediminum TaxID=2992112 RepID=A0AAE3M6B8_9BACT|nr:hypothetical protein [Plebeiobacterium sediminum]MCW3787655.1 hypothetical protein [Plebeiobacterium sediminum]